MTLLAELTERQATALADLADKSGMEDVANALRRAVTKAHRYPYELEVEAESDGPVNHGQTEPNDHDTMRFEFDYDDIADFVAEDYEDRFVARNAVSDLLSDLPYYTMSVIADHYAEKDAFKEFVAEREGE